MKIAKCPLAFGSLLALLVSPAVHAKLSVVTTLPSFADIARNVGGDDITVESLTRGTQDPHFVDAKPSLVLVLNRADLLIRVGLGLEDGWLPPLLTGARNGKIQTGAPGDLNVSAHIVLKEVPRSPIDRSMGDVHPGGNPHFMADPRNGIVAAKAIAERLAQLDPDRAADYNRRADSYATALKERIGRWEKALQPWAGRPVVTYHKSWLYFSEWARLTEVGFVEPKPGIPPSPSHVVELVALMKARQAKLVLMEPFYPRDTAEKVANLTGAKLLVLPVESEGSPEVKTYFDVFENIVRSLSQTQ